MMMATVQLWAKLKSLGHALKEVDGSAYAWTTTPQQVGLS